MFFTVILKGKTWDTKYIYALGRYGHPTVIKIRWASDNPNDMFATSFKSEWQLPLIVSDLNQRMFVFMQWTLLHKSLTAILCGGLCTTHNNATPKQFSSTQITHWLIYSPFFKPGRNKEDVEPPESDRRFCDKDYTSPFATPTTVKEVGIKFNENSSVM